MVSAILLFSEYPRDMHCLILSGSIPPPLSKLNIKQTFSAHITAIQYIISLNYAVRKVKEKLNR